MPSLRKSGHAVRGENIARQDLDLAHGVSGARLLSRGKAKPVTLGGGV